MKTAFPRALPDTGILQLRLSRVLGAAVLKLRHHIRESYVRKRILLKIDRLAPQSLEDLVSAGYIKAIPKDPMTNKANWEPHHQEDVLVGVDQQEPGIDNVHSASNATSSDGTAYSSW